MTKLLKLIVPVLVCAGFASAAAAQDQPATQYSNAQCEQAGTALATLQGQEDIPWSAQRESEKLYAIWSAPECAEYRNRGAVDVREGITDSKRILTENEIGVEDGLAEKREQCKTEVASEWKSADARFRASNTQADMLGSCVLRAEMLLYANGLERLRAQQNVDYQKAVQSRLDTIAADKAKHDAAVEAANMANEKAMDE